MASAKTKKQIPSTPLRPTLQTFLNFARFRILVMGKAGSGKSSLIDKMFGLDTVNNSGRKLNNPQYGATFDNNPRLFLHQYTVSEHDDHQYLYSFLKARTKPKSALNDRLHAIWLCVSSDNPQAESLDCLREVIDICKGNVVIILVFTKFDELVFKVIMNIHFDNLKDYMNVELRFERAKEQCRQQVEGVRQSLVRESGVPTVYTSVGEDLPETLEDLALQTEDAMKHWLNARSRVTLPILAWSVAQKYSRRIKVATSAHIGQWRFWSDLTNQTFVGERVQIVLDAIHADLIGVWNLGDTNKRLSSDSFKAKLLFLVSELVDGSSELSGTSTHSPTMYSGRQTDPRLRWANEVYYATVMQVGQVMAYIVSLSVILRKYLDKGPDVTEEHMEMPMYELLDDDIRTELREAVSTVPASPNGSDGMVIFHELKRLVAKFCLEEGERVVDD